MTKEACMIVLDFDGTITLLPHKGNSTWWRMEHKTLTDECKSATEFNRRYFLDRKKRGLMTDECEKTWLDQTVQAWVESRVHRDHIAEVFAENQLNVRPGFTKFLLWLKHRQNGEHVRVIINSYGFTQIIDHILTTLGVRELVDDIEAMNMVFDENGYFTGYEPNSVIVTTVKGARTENVRLKYEIPRSRVVGFGDSDGDKEIVWAGGNKVLLAFDTTQADHYRQHFDDVVISHDWSGPTTWLTNKFGL